MSLTIRPATVADAALVLAFIRDLAEYERLPHEVVATEELLRETLFGPAPGAEVLLAELDGEPAGFALFFHNFSTFLGRRGLYLEDLLVRPAARGRGVGRALLARLAAIARERECGRFEWSVLDWNESAIGFYRALGAVPMEDWTVYRVTGAALDRLADEDGRRAPAGDAPGSTGGAPPG
jgi:GNAT superfamily N-acetyltransferase